ncbi:hypothetical protein CANTEDRAFT_94545 [Yamadazyma tenuis ATCC 10573]|uniref:Uncharacterized protein n=1 Tax=Candida tenuis (strain ATCC 10573 / BCRC 21748 / CBS 615 / JCM 9827 / NBRC 10315 / NRRL Y-1498 / VKM Y-70) TaxID=590646 RepID=G3B7N7_CANTC|nr:uncharacterized protein CANTEDRAFT_94545 [Yamadazyma tenuis ATCC 10573]EGV61659.1 hypothetical protein CANTEDRAFT_94545 [Yamadazyma tenuis ATCC 10573]
MDSPILVPEATPNDYVSITHKSSTASLSTMSDITDLFPSRGYPLIDTIIATPLGELEAASAQAEDFEAVRDHAERIAKSLVRRLEPLRTLGTFDRHIPQWSDEINSFFGDHPDIRDAYESKSCDPTYYVFLKESFPFWIKSFDQEVILSLHQKNKLRHNFDQRSFKEVWQYIKANEVKIHEFKIQRVLRDLMKKHPADWLHYEQGTCFRREYKDYLEFLDNHGCLLIQLYWGLSLQNKRALVNILAQNYQNNMVLRYKDISNVLSCHEDFKKPRNWD